MARKALIRSTCNPYHIYNRVILKQFYADSIIERVWEIYQEKAWEGAMLYGVRIHSLLLMSNHYHLLVSTPCGNIDQFMWFFQREISTEISRLHSSTFRYKFDGRYRWKLIKSPIQFARTYKYILQNPVEAGISRSSGTYPYSTLYASLGCCCLRILTWESAEFGQLVPNEPEALLRWADSG